jgi:adenine-specific DNA-methyltransferase
LNVASELNRQWIGVDNSPKAIDTILKRFAVGREAMGDFVNDKADKYQSAKPMTLFDLAAAKVDSSDRAIRQNTLSGPRKKAIKFSVFSLPEKEAELAKIIGKWVG